MELKEFYKNLIRMCGYYENCDDCPRQGKVCSNLALITDITELEELEKDVEKWSKEHPQKTRLQDFMEKYPDAAVHPDGQPVICCARLGYREYCGKVFGSDACFVQCKDCWNMMVEECE